MDHIQNQNQNDTFFKKLNKWLGKRGTNDKKWVYNNELKFFIMPSTKHEISWLWKRFFLIFNKVFQVSLLNNKAKILLIYQELYQIFI